MKAKLIILTALLTTSLYAEVFELIDSASEEVYGPFAYSNGVTVVIEDEEFVLKKIPTKAEITVENMKSIMIKSIEFRQANITDVINFFIESMAETDPENSECLCLNTVNKPASTKKNQESEFGDSFFESPKQEKDIQTITLSLRRVSLYDALVVVTLMADLEFEIDAQGIVNISKKEFTVP